MGCAARREFAIGDTWQGGDGLPGAARHDHMDRDDFLRSLIPARGRILEIGAGYRPLFAKRDGYRVETADYTDAAGLRAKYRTAANVDLARIEEVDHVVGAGGLAATVGARDRYDAIVASHVIEHTPDLLGFLKDCETLLASSGVLLLAVPDKRYCFDVFQPLSSTGAVVQAHLDRRTRPPHGAVLDDRLYNATRDGAIGWSAKAGGALAFVLDLMQALAHAAAEREADSYIDVHVWKFVPSSFRLILHDLHALGEIALREDRFFDNHGAEFYTTLSPTGGGCPIDRLTLARRMLAEQTHITTN
jgi:2-polyprenyl-3-methyl-5-hydroxy-6-metoxy-1,4-benzoquinol methylase